MLHSVGRLALIVHHPINSAVLIVDAVIFDKLVSVACVVKKCLIAQSDIRF